MADQFPAYQPVPEAGPSGVKKGLAIAGFVVGILNLCAWFLPICGGPLAVVGIVLSALGINSSQKTLAIIGLVLSVIGLIATIVNAVAGAVIGIQNPNIFNQLVNNTLISP